MLTGNLEYITNRDNDIQFIISVPSPPSATTLQCMFGPCLTARSAHTVTLAMAGPSSIGAPGVLSAHLDCVAANPDTASLLEVCIAAATILGREFPTNQCTNCSALTWPTQTLCEGCTLEAATVDPVEFHH